VLVAVPSGVVTETVPVWGALLGTAKVTVVAVALVIPADAAPWLPWIDTAVAPVRLRPVIVTLSPGSAMAGEIEVICGGEPGVRNDCVAPIYVVLPVM
jgi:hypothetical protein